MLQHYIRDNDGSIIEITDRVQMRPRDGGGPIGLATNADEGSTGSCSITVEDPFGTFNVRGHRLYYAVESEASADDYGGVVYVGYTTGRRIARGSYRTATGRAWVVSLVDQNSVLSRRILVGSDCKRPAETDIARVTWALATAEMAPVQNDTTYVAGTAVNMSKADYTGQSILSVLDDCAQQSGRDYYTVQETDALTYRLWYQRGTSSDRTSEIRISNVLSDVDSDVTFAPALDSDLVREPGRVFSGVFQQFDGGYSYVQSNATATAFARRDTVGRGENVKTKAAATARARRYLTDIDSEDDTISTAIIVSAARVNVVMPGMRIDVKMTYMPGYEDFAPMRVIDRTVRELSPLEAQRLLNLEAPVDGLYEIALTLNAPEPGTGDEVGEVFGVLQYGHGIYGAGGIGFERPGDNPPAGWNLQPTVGPLTPLTDPTYPEGRNYYAWQMDGDGTVDVYLHLSAAGVIGSDTTVAFEILLNGAQVAVAYDSQSAGGLTFMGVEGVATVAGLAVANGDIISARVTANATVYFFTVPQGVGVGGEVLAITGGTLA